MHAAPAPTAPSAIRAALATGLFVLGSVVAGAVVAVLLQRAGLMPGRVAPERFVRRCMMLCAALLLWPYLRAVGVRWPQDLGWKTSAETPLRLFGRGLLLGLLTLAPLAVAALWLGTRYWNPAAPPGVLIGKSAGYLASACLIGVLEESFARGLLFLALRRAWGALPAAVITGALFAWAHFLEPSAEALLDPSWFGAIGGLLRSAPLHLLQEEYISARFLNLVLMSGVLCASVWRSGSIWLAAGLHAGWVWLKKVQAVVSDSCYDHPWRACIGARSDFLDGWGCSVLLLLLLAWLLSRPGHPRRPADH